MILQIEASHQNFQLSFSENSQKPTLLEGITLAIRDFKEENFWVQVTIFFGVISGNK